MTVRELIEAYSIDWDIIVNIYDIRMEMKESPIDGIPTYEYTKLTDYTPYNGYSYETIEDIKIKYGNYIEYIKIKYGNYEVLRLLFFDRLVPNHHEGGATGEIGIVIDYFNYKNDKEKEYEVLLER